jgi:hypothetical protein
VHEAEHEALSVRPQLAERLADVVGRHSDSVSRCCSESTRRRRRSPAWGDSKLLASVCATSSSTEMVWVIPMVQQHGAHERVTVARCSHEGVLGTGWSCRTQGGGICRVPPHQ